MLISWPIPDHWQFELVGLLALLGDSSIREVMYPLTAWPYVWIPRLIPAPHALIQPRRLIKLPSNPNGKVVGVYSGNLLDHLPYFADTLYPIDEVPSHTVTEMSVEINSKTFRRFRTRHLSWLNAITVGSCLLTLALLGIAIYVEDSAAIAAISSLAASGSLMSLAAQWSVKEPPEVVEDKHLPKGQVVIYCAQGAFVVVKCNEATARALYLHDSHGCEYLIRPPLYQIVVGIGTILLLSGVVFIKNCTRDMQLALGTSYIALNAAYVVMSLSRNATHKQSWDLKSALLYYKVDKISPQEERYTNTLSKVIHLTESSDWLRRIPTAAPKTDKWKEILRKFDEEAAMARSRPKFNPHKTLSDMFEQESEMGMRQRVMAEVADIEADASSGPHDQGGRTSGADVGYRTKAE